MATLKRALLIGPSYAPDLSEFSQPEGVQNDVRLMRDMLSRNGFHPENIMVCEVIINMILLQAFNDNSTLL